jgi:DNA-binding NtrC family response regulator
VAQLDGRSSIKKEDVIFSGNQGPPNSASDFVMPANLLPQTPEGVTRAHLEAYIAAAEKNFIKTSLGLLKQNKKRLSEQLNFSRNYIYGRMKTLGLALDEEERSVQHDGN